MHRALVIVGLLVLLVPGRSLAQTGAPPTRESLVSMLSGFEDTPTLAEIRALGEAAVPLLVAIHDDPSVIAPVRLRAVEAVGAFTTPAARRFLLRVLADPSEPTAVVREAIEALASAAGPEAVSPIGAFLASDDRGVRERAIEALGTIDTAAARRLLAAHVAREHDAALADRARALATASGARTTH